MTLFRRVSITRKFITLALLVSATVWGLLDCFQSKMIESIFQQHVDADLQTAAQEDRKLFDAYLASFRQSVRILITNQKITAHFLTPEWNNESNTPIILRRMPQWLPGRSVLRAMPQVHYFLLFDKDAHVREIYTEHTENIPSALKNPSPIFHKLSHNQSLLTRLGDAPFVVTSETIFTENDTLLGYLMLASRLDNDFIYASVQGMHRDNLIALVDNKTNTVIADNNPDAALTGISKNKLTQQYHFFGKTFFDYGSSDLDAHFISLIPKEHYQAMGKKILAADRWNRALTGGSILASLCVILFSITRRISRVTYGIDIFAEQELQTAMLSSKSGDQLLILEERFHVLGQQVIETRNHLQEQVAERTKEYQTANCLLEKEVAERIKAEAILRNTAMFQKAILDSAKHIIISTDMLGSVIMLNAAAEHLLGYTAKEVIGKDIVELIYDHNEIIRQADALRCESGYKVEQDFEVIAINACKKDKVEEYEWTYITKNKDRFPVRQTVTAIRDETNQITGFLNISSDIREIRAAEQALHETAVLNDRIIHETPVGLLIFDQAGQCIVANNAVAKMLGGTREEVLLQNYNEIASWKESGMLEAAKKSLAEGKKCHLEFDNLTSFGKNGFYKSVFVPFTLHDELHLLLMLNDISERKKAEKQLKSNLTEKEALLKEIHHRVKNNMQIVASLMFLQAQQIENKEALKALQDSQDRVKSMGLVHELLYRSDNLSKVSFSKYIETLACSLRESYDGVKNDVSFRIEAEGIELPVDTAIPCGLIVNELITNSFKYAFKENRPGSLYVRFAREEDLYILSVSDNGVGLPTDYDWRSTATLGLSLVRTLSEQLDGQVEFTNDNGLTCRLSFKSPHLVEQKTET
ncbi:MAG: PAS domain S-box protein [Candidatus Electrothrix sp. AR4]|nr:PAS domain S-box protein [Candidatus Electrothrix sp. AR4]